MSSLYRLFAATTTAALFTYLFITGVAFAQNAANSMPHDAGVRGGSAGAGGPLSGLGAVEQSYFRAARARFQEVDLVQGTVNGAPPGIQSGGALGPRCDLNECPGCHARRSAAHLAQWTVEADGRRQAIQSAIQGRDGTVIDNFNALPAPSR